MSVAFRRDSDEEHLEPRFELPIPPGPNFVTPAGLAQIEARVAELETAVGHAKGEDVLKALKRDLRYWQRRKSTAQPAPPPRPGEIGIGSTVGFTLAGTLKTATITGFDEADPTQGRIAFSAPLARALLGASVGDWIDFAGTDEAIKIIEVRASAR